ncbi:MAG TPA: OmpA family protein [Caulobacteraceae bacterium]|nr:OmpA family protein [Caulobacteraceae bacterium]
MQTFKLCWASAAALATVLMAGCASTPAPLAVGSCADADLSIYFADNSAELTGPAHDVIADAGRKAARCTVSEVEVVGLADYHGPPQPNLELSRKRAEAVALALEKAGLPTPRFEVTAAGEAGAIASPGVAEPMRRKAEVVIRYKR